MVLGLYILSDDDGDSSVADMFGRLYELLNPDVFSGTTIGLRIPRELLSSDVAVSIDTG